MKNWGDTPSATLKSSVACLYYVFLWTWGGGTYIFFFFKYVNNVKLTVLYVKR